MELKEQVRHTLNKPAMSGWKSLVAQNPSQVLADVITLTGEAIAAGKDQSLKMEILDDVLAGRQHLSDFDINVMFRRHT